MLGSIKKLISLILILALSAFVSFPAFANDSENGVKDSGVKDSSSTFTNSLQFESKSAETKENMDLKNDELKLAGPGDVPSIYSGAKEYGFYVSKSIRTSFPFKNVKVDTSVKLDDPDTSVITEVLASEDGNTWTQRYEADSSDQIITFPDHSGPFNYIKYIITIISSQNNDGTTVDGINFEFTKAEAQLTCPQKSSR